MYQPYQPLQRIDQHVGIKQSELYEPLRRSLLRRNLSQSNISSRSNLSMSRVNDLSSSRVSRRLRSLSPQQLDQIKNNTFVPIAKRLVPTKNLNVIKDKRFEAIDVEERVHRPIPAIRFNSINRFNINRVEEIVYQPEDQVNAAHYQRVYQPAPLASNFQNYYPQAPTSPQPNIYTTRNSYVTPGFTPSYNVSQVREYSPREAYNLGMDSRPMMETFGGRNSIGMPVPIQQQQNYYVNYESHYEGQKGNNHMNTVVKNGNTNNNVTSFENSPAFNVSTLPIITSTGLQHQNPPLSQNPTAHQPLLPNLYTSQCTPQIRQLPTEHTLSFLASPFGSRTSFEPDIQKPQSPLNRSYDFSKLTQDSSTSEYKQKKQQEWKYNLFSILDEPANTKCSKTGCFKNEIIATRPNVYEWQQ